MSSASDRTAMLKYKCLAADKWSLYPATQDVNMACHSIKNLSGISFCNSDVTITANSGEVDISGSVVFNEPPQTPAAPTNADDLVNKAYVDATVTAGVSTWSIYPATQDIDISCNKLNRVEAINFCDGAYIGPGSSFDISSGDVIKIVSDTGAEIIVDGSNGRIDLVPLTGLVRIMGDIANTNFASLEFNDPSVSSVSQVQLSHTQPGEITGINVERLMLQTDALKKAILGIDISDGYSYVRSGGLDLRIECAETTAAAAAKMLLSKYTKTVDVTAVNGLRVNNTVSAQNFLSLTQFKGFPQNTVDLSALNTGDTLRQKWTGGVLASNGKIYGIPYDTTSVLIFDPITNTIDTTTLSSTSFPSIFTGSGRWWGGVLASNGKIYGIPYNSTNILVIDPYNNTLTTIDISGLVPAPVAGGWVGGVLAPNGTDIYCAPYNATRILKINTINDTASYVVTAIAGSTKFAGGVLAPNGFIYFIPRTAANIFYVNTATDAVASTAHGQGVSWSGGVLGQDGLVYWIPYSNGNIVVMTPGPTGTPAFTTIASPVAGSNKWNGGILAANGRIYGIPYDNNNVLVINTTVTPATATTIPTGISLTINAKWLGGVLAPNGRIYGIPHGALAGTNMSIIAQILTSLPTSPPWMLEAYFNKF
jgi:hypothetical protein